MEGYIPKDLVKYVISDYLAYPYIIYCQYLKLNKRRKCVFKSENYLDSENVKNTLKYIDNNLISEISKHKNGKICSTIYKGKIIVKKTSKYNKTYEISKYLNGFLHGWCIKVSQVRFCLVKFKQYYLKGILNGPFTTYDDGSIHINTYKNGIIDGLYEYYNKGKLKEKGYKFKNFYIGKFESFDDNGLIKEIKNYDINGNLNGFQYEYFDEKLYSIEFYKCGDKIDSVSNNNSTSEVFDVFTEYYTKNK
jgi:hypothetical protein